MALLTPSARALRPLRLLITLAVLLAAEPASRLGGQAPSVDFTRTGTFPAGFLLGVATSAHQVEGGHTASDWARFETRPEVANAGAAVEHASLQVLAQDLDRARSIGLSAYRFSIEWSRIEPQRDIFDPAAVAYYQQAVDMMRSRGLAPFATLEHFTLPSWLLDPDDPDRHPGWATSDSVQQFAEYVAHVADALGSRVDFWMTFNEPTVQLVAGYVSGAWPPGLTGRWDLYVAAIGNMIDAHKAAYTTLKTRDKDDADGDSQAAVVGIVQNVKPILPAVDSPAEHQDARDWDYILHKHPLDALTGVFDTGAFPVPAYAQASRSPGTPCRDDDIDYACDAAAAGGFLDFIGINYHNTSTSSFTPLAAANPPLGDSTTAGITESALLSFARLGRPSSDYPAEDFARGPWEIHPEGLFTVLRDVWGRYHLPMYITENGLSESAERCASCAVTKRPAFIVSHLQAIMQALVEGIPVRGYFYWSLLDNFEWREAYDTRAKFGLYHVRLNDETIPLLKAGQTATPPQTQELDPTVPGYGTRTETWGAVAYRQIAAAHGITREVLDRWGSFPRLVGDRAVVGSVRTIQANPPFAVPGDLRTEGVDVVTAPIPAGCDVFDVSVVLTDSNGTAVPQTVIYRQGGRVADARFPPARRVEIRTAPLGGTSGNVTLAWSRTSITVGSLQYLPPVAYRVVYRLECSDSDQDGVIRPCDNCPLVANPAQADTDADSLGDACDPDDDNDQLTDVQEALLGTNPLNPDMDGDGLPDGRDVEWLQAAVGAQPLSAFHPAAAAGVRGLLLFILENVEQSMTAGDETSALALIAWARARMDGCGTIPDATDWIVDCVSQAKIRPLLDLLAANISSD